MPVNIASSSLPCKETIMDLGKMLFVVLLLMLIGLMPDWSHTHAWGYGPSGGLGVAVIVLGVMLMMRRL
jgi:hypothetical protein